MRAANHFALAKQQALATLSSKPHSAKAQIMALGGRLDVLTQPITDDSAPRSRVFNRETVTRPSAI